MKSRLTIHRVVLTAIYLLLPAAGFAAPGREDGPQLYVYHRQIYATCAYLLEQPNRHLVDSAEEGVFLVTRSRNRPLVKEVTIGTLTSFFGKKVLKQDLARPITATWNLTNGHLRGKSDMHILGSPRRGGAGQAKTRIGQ